MFSYSSIFLLIHLFRCQAYWQIDWSDEFNRNSLDYTKWDVANEEEGCDGNHIQQVNCKTNSLGLERDLNLWLLNGTLSIAAVQHKRLEKNFTSAQITTRDSFTFGRFEIRAALPKGKFLRPAIYFFPTKNTGNWPKDGQIDMMTNIQTRNLGNGVHLVLDYPPYIGNEYTTPFGTQLNQFHNYVVEWNHTYIVWKFDEKQHLTINLSEQLKSIENPFVHPFKFVITLGVGGQFFNGNITDEDARNWNCSLLILDYVRVYKWIEGVESSSDKSKGNQISSSDICGKIMPLIRLPEDNPPEESKISIATIIYVLALILILILFSLVIYLFVRQKRLRLITESKFEQELYDDIPVSNLETNYYESVKEDENEYVYPYQNPLPDSSWKERPKYLSLTNDYQYSDTIFESPVQTQ